MAELNTAQGGLTSQTASSPVPIESPTASQKSETKSAESRQASMNESLPKFVAQLSDGCHPADVKPVCFSKFCKRNVLAELAFEDSRELMRFALKTLSACKMPGLLVCPRGQFFITRQNLRSLSVDVLAAGVLDNVAAFCCSFGKNLTDEDLGEASANVKRHPRMAQLSVDFRAA